MASAIFAGAKTPVAIVHTRTLRDQAAAEIPELADVYTIQGLLSKGPDGDARRRRIQRADMVWVDEAHHVAAEDWVAILPLVQHAKTFGCTATPQRADGRALTEFWSHLVVGASYSELLALGHLCPCDVAKPELDRLTQRSQGVRPDGVASYLALGKRADGGWRPGIHCDLTIADCTEAVERYKKAGVRAELVCCDTGDDDRQGIFDRFSSGQLDMLASPMALSEGFDSPRAEVLVSCRTFSNLGTYIQWAGRILRPYCAAQVERWSARMVAKGLTMHPSALVAKERALFIDTTDAASVHGHPTADREYSLDGRGMRLKAEAEAEEEERARGVIERPEQVATTYELIRDRVVEHYLQLEELARERGYHPGWVYYRMRDLGIEPPRTMVAKYASTCVHCRRRVRATKEATAGETIMWAGAKQVFHRDCWFASLNTEQLTPAFERLNDVR